MPQIWRVAASHSLARHASLKGHINFIPASGSVGHEAKSTPQFETLRTRTKECGVNDVRGQPHSRYLEVLEAKFYL